MRWVPVVIRHSKSVIENRTTATCFSMAVSSRLWEFRGNWFGDFEFSSRFCQRSLVYRHAFSISKWLSEITTMDSQVNKSVIILPQFVAFLCNSPSIQTTRVAQKSGRKATCISPKSRDERRLVFSKRRDERRFEFSVGTKGDLYFAEKSGRNDYFAEKKPAAHLFIFEFSSRWILVDIPQSWCVFFEVNPTDPVLSAVSNSSQISI